MRGLKLLSLLFVAVFVFGMGVVPSDAAFKVGLVFDIGGRGDRSFNDSAYSGLKLAAEQLKGFIKDDPDKVNFGEDVEIKYMEPQEGGQDREQLLRALAESGYNIIFAVGFMFTDSVVNVAKDFPDVRFALIDGYVDALDENSNITCLGFKEEEGSFLVGAIAGLATKGNKIGFVGGMDIPLIHKFEAGYRAGAAFVNPELRKDGAILGMYAGNQPTAFNDPTKGKQITETFIQQGADVIYHASGGTGVGMFQACFEAKKWGIGVDSDQGFSYAKSGDPKQIEMAKFILTSMLKRVDNAVLQTILTAKDNSLKGGYKVFGLAEDGVGYALNDENKDNLKDFTVKVDELKAKIIAGEIKVPADDKALADFLAGLK